MKFEIKGHDGPGRYGKLGDDETPVIINKDKYQIIDDEAVSYDIERELAIWSVNQTIKKAEEVDEKEVKSLREKLEEDFGAFMVRQSLWFRWGMLILLMAFTLIYGEYGIDFDSAQFIYFTF